MNPTTPSRSMTDHTMDLTSWLNHLHYLMPPTGMVIIGAGIGSLGKMLGEWEVPVAHFIEADEKQIQRMEASLTGHTDWHIYRALLWRTSAEISFYQASNPAESGILQPETLASLWPNLKTRDKESRQSTTLDSLLHDIQPQMAPNWLIVDCLPALSILQGAGKWLDTSEVIVARVILDDDIVPDEGASKPELDGFLQANGFRCIALQEERQPKVVSALYVREYKPQLDQLTQAKAALEQDKNSLAARRDELEQQVADLTHARDEQAQLAAEQQAQLAAANQVGEERAKQLAEQQTQLDQLKQVKATLEQDKTALTARRDELEKQVVELTRARDEQAQFVAERQAQLTAANQADEERAKQLAERQTQLDQITQTAAALERDKNALVTRRDDLEQQVVELTQARDEQAQLAAERQAELTAASQAGEERAKQLAEQKTQLDQITQTAAALERDKNALAARRDELEQQVAELSRARDEQAQLAAERQKKLGDLQSRNEQLQNEKAEIAARQQLMQDDLAKAEVQIDLITDLLLRETGL